MGWDEEAAARCHKYRRPSNGADYMNGHWFSSLGATRMACSYGGI